VSAPRELSASHSHLYPGARGSADAPLADGPVALTFADGTRVTGHLTGDRLSLDAHRTAKGTAIATKTWIIAMGPTDPEGRVPFRVTARGAGGEYLR
jgi:hypothetical protein